MKKTILLIALLFATTLFAFGQKTDQQTMKADKDAQQVTALTKSYLDAVIKRDAAAIDRILADDYMEFSHFGGIYSKSRILDQYKSPAPADDGKLESFDVTEQKVRIYDNTAVSTARITAHFKTKDGKPGTDATYYTVVSVKKNGQWRMVSAHGNRIAEEMPKMTETPK